MQAGRNTTGFKSNCWHLCDLSGGDEVSILIQLCCHRVERVCVCMCGSESVCLEVGGGGRVEGGSHP